MARKINGVILFIVGLVLVIAGLVVMLVVVPDLKQFPDDVDTTRRYTGTMPVLLNRQNLEFMTDLEVELVRHFETEATDGEVALVLEEQTLQSQGTTLLEIVKRHAINRKSMEFTTKYPESWKGKDGLIDRAGLVLGWPIDSEKKDYVGWSDDYLDTVTLKFEEEVEHERAKLKTYHFTSKSEPRPIAPQAVAAMGLPTELTHEQLGQMVGGLDINPMIARALPVLIEQAGWPDPVPLTYTYEYEAEYWIEPDTGVLIDTHKIEIRKAGFAEDLMASLAEQIETLGIEPEVVAQFLPVTVYHLEYQATDQTVEEAKKDAEDAQNTIQLYGTTLPIAAIVVGVLFALIGLVIVKRS